MRQNWTKGMLVAVAAAFATTTTAWATGECDPAHSGEIIRVNSNASVERWERWEHDGPSIRVCRDLFGGLTERQ